MFFCLGSIFVLLLDGLINPCVFYFRYIVFKSDLQLLCSAIHFCMHNDALLAIYKFLFFPALTCFSRLLNALVFSYACEYMQLICLLILLRMIVYLSGCFDRLPDLPCITFKMSAPLWLQLLYSGSHTGC